jgi:hypothetical protein
LLEPRNAVLCRTILHISVEIEQELSEVIERVAARSALDVTAHWFSDRRLADQPLIELRASRVEKDGRSGEILDFGKLLGVLSEGQRLIIRAPAGRGTIRRTSRKTFLRNIPPIKRKFSTLIVFSARFRGDR